MPSIRKSVPGSEDTADKGATHRNISSTRKHWDPELGATHLQAEWVFEVSNAQMEKSHKEAQHANTAVCQEYPEGFKSENIKIGHI